MEFDKTVNKVIDGYELKYGIIHGNENIVFIKCGAGGSIPGKDGKYLKMAYRLNKKTGATVICSAYPYPSDDILLEYDEKIINKLISKFSSHTLSFIGVSRGAYVGLTYLSERFKFSKLILINMPLMINFHKSVEALPSKKVLFVYGELDPSVTYIPYLKLYHSDVMTVPNANHTFDGMSDEFVALVDLLSFT